MQQLLFYYRNLARSIREKATDMALGLVQPRTESISGMRGYEISSPAKTQRHYKKSRKSSNNKVNIKLDVILDTPVLVVPRSSCSPQVFVAHLGKISVSNFKTQDMTEDGPEFNLSNEQYPPYDRKNSVFTTSEDLKFSEELAQKFQNVSNNMNFDDDDEDTQTIENDNIEQNILMNEIDEVLDEYQRSRELLAENLEKYSIDIRNMNLYSLDTSNRKGMRLSALPRAEEFYSCQNDAVAVIHDTAIRLQITRITESSIDLLSDPLTDTKDTLHITGSVIKPLRLSLSRRQYEQLIETFDNIFKVPTDLVKPPQDIVQQTTTIHVSADPFSLDLDKNTNRRLIVQDSMSDKKPELEPKVTFDLPTFIIQLQDEKHNPVIEITFRDFSVQYEKNNQYETNVQVSLRSILMEDLLCSVDSKNRSMVTSLAPESILRPSTAFSSHSCPNLINLKRMYEEPGGSLPHNLDAGFAAFTQTHKVLYPGTPPPSPQPKTRQDNLVIYSSLLVDPDCPNFETQYNSLKQSSSIDFNCLNLIVSVKSWLVVLNFFGLISDDRSSHNSFASNELNTASQIAVDTVKSGNTELKISVRSLTLVLIRSDYELAKANVSNAHFVVSSHSEMNMVEGRLGSVSLYDLTSHGIIYREKFVTSGNEALSFFYVK